MSKTRTLLVLWGMGPTFHKVSLNGHFQAKYRRGCRTYEHVVVFGLMAVIIRNHPQRLSSMESAWTLCNRDPRVLLFSYMHDTQHVSSIAAT